MAKIIWPNLMFFHVTTLSMWLEAIFHNYYYVKLKAMFSAWIYIALLWLTYGAFKQNNMVAGKTAIIEITKYQEIENDVCFSLE